MTPSWAWFDAAGTQNTLTISNAADNTFFVYAIPDSSVTAVTETIEITGEVTNVGNSD